MIFLMILHGAHCHCYGHRLHRAQQGSIVSHARARQRASFCAVLLSQHTCTAAKRFPLEHPNKTASGGAGRPAAGARPPARGRLM